ncbi:MAG: DMT family transporter [Haloarculaceae archaeon]
MLGRRSVASFLVTAVLFGGTFVGAKAGLAYFPPLLFVAFRYDVAALVLGGWVVATVPQSERVPRTRGDVAGILATGILVIGLTNGLLFVGQQYATSAVGSIVFSLNPVLTPVFAAALLSDERLTARGAVGLLLALVGVGLVVDPNPSNLLAGSVVGKAVLFGGAVTGALGTVLIRRADADLSSTVRTAWGLPIAALLNHALSAAAGESVASVTLTPTAVAALLYVSVFAGAVAYVAYFALIDSAGAINANLVHYAVPIVATAGGWALLGETVSATVLAGFLAILVGFAVIGSESVPLRSLIPVGRVADRPSESRIGVGEEPNGFESD